MTPMIGSAMRSDRFGSDSAPPQPPCLFALKLPTRSLNIVAARPAHVDLHALFTQNLLETLDLLRHRPPKTAPGVWIEGNYVYLAGNIPKQARELPGLLLGIIHAAEQNIFESDPLAPRNRKFAAAIQHLLERILAIRRHQLAAQLVRRRMQRNRQIDARLFHQFFDLRHQSDRGERHAAW